MPRCRKIHSRASATVLKSTGAERRPNGRSPTIENPLNCGRLGEPEPVCRPLAHQALPLRFRPPGFELPLPFLSTDVYWMEQKRESMPSLTLAPSGNERSVIKCHFLEVWPLGTTPSQLMYPISREKGPRMRPAVSSTSRYRSVTSGCCSADGMFRRAGCSCPEWSNPTQNPCCKPSITTVANSLSGCDDKLACQAGK